MRKFFSTFIATLIACGGLALRAQNNLAPSPEEAVESLRSLLGPLAGRPAVVAEDEGEVDFEDEEDEVTITASEDDEGDIDFDLDFEDEDDDDDVTVAVSENDEGDIDFEDEEDVIVVAAEDDDEDVDFDFDEDEEDVIVADTEDDEDVDFDFDFDFEDDDDDDDDDATVTMSENDEDDIDFDIDEEDPVVTDVTPDVEDDDEKVVTNLFGAGQNGSGDAENEAMKAIAGATDESMEAIEDATAAGKKALSEATEEGVTTIKDETAKGSAAIGEKRDEATSAIDAKIGAAAEALAAKAAEAGEAIDNKVTEAGEDIDNKVAKATETIDTRVEAGTTAIQDATAAGTETIAGAAEAASNDLTKQAGIIAQDLSLQYTIAVDQQQAAEAAKQEAEQKIGELDDLLTNRKRIAMIPFACAQSTFTTGNENTLATSISDALRSDFNQFFLQSPHFRVVSRQDDAVVDDELARIINNAAVSGNFNDLYKVGMELSLDYVLVGSVKQFFIAPPQVNTVQLTGARYVTIPRALAELDYRIVNIATKEIIWADHIFIDLTSAEIKEAKNDVATLYQVLNQMASRRIAEAMDAIVPIRVVQITPAGQFVLDRAGNLIIPGSFFDIYRQGEPILDPATGEELGRPEELVTTIQIKRVDPKLSYGEIVIGSGIITPIDLESGLVARPHREPVYAAPQEVPAAPPVIKLPMDF